MNPQIKTSCRKTITKFSFLCDWTSIGKGEWNWFYGCHALSLYKSILKLVICQLQQLHSLLWCHELCALLPFFCNLSKYTALVSVLSLKFLTIVILTTLIPRFILSKIVDKYKLLINSFFVKSINTNNFKFN